MGQKVKGSGRSRTDEEQYDAQLSYGADAGYDPDIHLLLAAGVLKKRYVGQVSKRPQRRKSCRQLR